MNVRIVFAAAIVVSLSTQAWALDKCRYERKRAVSPPGQPIVKVHFGANEKYDKFSEAQKLFDYLKQVDGKLCEVDWIGAKKEMEDWLANQDFVESHFGSELNGLIYAQQKKSQPTSESKMVSPRSCDARLADVKALVSALKASIYNSQEKRAAAVSDIIGVLEEK